MTPTVPVPLDVVPVPAFSDNYIWLISPTPEIVEMADRRGAGGKGNVIVVDPGQAQPVIAALQARGLTLSAILLTHHHADHVGGVAELLAYANAPVPVYGPANEKIAHVTVRLSEGDVVEIDAPCAHFTVIDVPGHTAGHIAYFQPASGDQPARIFCGDTLFASGCGRLFEGTPAQMLASLDKLAALPDDTQVFCAHEYTLSNLRFAVACDGQNEALLAWQQRASAMRARGEPTLPTTMGHERQVNPFLRADSPGVMAGLTAHVGTAPSDRLAAFTALRGWKDHF